jgi:outer membrane biosynthesis protein TonB
VNQEIIRATAIITELKINNEIARQLQYTMGNLLTVQSLLLEQIHYTQTISQAQSSSGRILNKAVFAVNMTEEEPPKPPPNEDEPNPPIKEPPTEEPPVKEPPPKNS